MVAIVSTVAYLGLEARSVEVQVQLASGVPAFGCQRTSRCRGLELPSITAAKLMLAWGCDALGS